MFDFAPQNALQNFPCSYQQLVSECGFQYSIVNNSLIFAQPKYRNRHNNIGRIHRTCKMNACSYRNTVFFINLSEIHQLKGTTFNFPILSLAVSPNI